MLDIDEPAQAAPGNRRVPPLSTSRRKQMIEIENLTKRYGDTCAVDDLTFTVRPGVVTGFL
ncbi:MAG: hypothetical protein ABSH51_29895, partial [Solirubrobacteraceae bacterium]